MEIFKSRKTAVAVFVLVVIVFTLIGCHRSLSKACAHVEEAFFDRDMLAGYGTHTAPGDQLENCLKLSNRLLSVIGGSDALSAEYTAVAEARQLLAETLESRDISDIYDTNALLVLAVYGVDEKVQSGVSLPESYDDYDSIVSDFFSAQRVVSESPYNDYVDDFIRTTVRPFPTNLLRLASFTALPEKFE